MTEEQSIALAQLEQRHPRVVRVPDDHPVAEEILSQCVTDTRVYHCPGCHQVVTIEPDGEPAVWGLEPQ